MSALAWIVCTLLWVSNIMAYQQFVHLFQISSLCVISLQYRMSFADFSLWFHKVMQIYVSHSCWQEKPMLLKRKLNEPPGYITNVINPYAWLMAWVTSLPARPLQKISATTDHVCQIALIRKLSRKFKKWCNVSSGVKAKSFKMKSHKTRTTCTDTLLHGLFHQLFLPTDSTPNFNFI